MPWKENKRIIMKSYYVSKYSAGRIWAVMVYMPIWINQPFVVFFSLDHCVGNPCGEHGTCINGADAFTCDCEPGYEPPLCERISIYHIHDLISFTSNNEICFAIVTAVCIGCGQKIFYLCGVYISGTDTVNLFTLFPFQCIILATLILVWIVVYA